MAIGMSRREQWALIGVVALIALGLGFEGWRRSRADGPVVYVPGQGRWEKVADFEAGKRPVPLAASSLGASGPKVGDRAKMTSGTTMGGIDLNLATAEELDRLPGIGAVRAAAILELRTRIGGFSSVEQLDQVSGIGVKTMDRLRPYVRVSARLTSASASAVHAAPMAQAATIPAAVVPQASTKPDMAAPPPRAEAAASAVKAPARPKAGAAVKAAAVETVDINQAGAEELRKIKGIGPALAGRIVEDRKLHGLYRSAEELTRVKGIGPVSVQKMKPQIRIGPGRAEP